MTIYYVPEIGSSGRYDLLQPFTKYSDNNVEYICRAIRHISDWLASNEEVKEIVYDSQGIDEAVWKNDVNRDARIVSLQSLAGQWVHVPEQYIRALPSADGIRYRSVLIGASLPMLPADLDLAGLMQDIKTLIDGRLGVASVVKTVDTSTIQLLEKDKHESLQQSRNQAINGAFNIYNQMVSYRNQVESLQLQLAALEDYIKQNHVP